MDALATLAVAAAGVAAGGLLLELTRPLRRALRRRRRLDAPISELEARDRCLPYVDTMSVFPTIQPRNGHVPPDEDRVA